MGFIDTELRYVDGNAALANILGVASVVGLAPSELGAGGGQMEALVRGVLRTGQPKTVGAPGGRISYHRVLDASGVAFGVGVVSVADSARDRSVAQLTLEADTDGLTGVLNHRVFQDRVRLEVVRAVRHHRPLSLAMIDIDGFKQLNDTFGHQVGDDVLTTVATHLAHSVRATDTVARLGGDEFALLLPETDAAAAEAFVDRAHEAIRRDHTHRGVAITVSIGICDMEDAKSVDDLIRFADGALFWSKSHGRDLVCRYRPDTVQDLSLEQKGERLLRSKALAGIRSLARAIDAKDHSTLLHSERVASLAGRLAEASGWQPDCVAALRETALIHDVGKIGVPQDVLLKPSALTRAEYLVVQTHAILGAQIASDVLSDDQTAWLRGHHERYDGTGYPDGLLRDAIPEGAQLLALADAWDVMTSERSYSHTMKPTEAIAECQRCAGTQFNPTVVSILTRPGFERILRMFANEQATRDRNEARIAGSSASSFTLHCECGADDCDATIDVPADEYRSVRKNERRYLVHVGHEIPEVEETLVRTDNYNVVEKV